jgi:hypothetical protein
MERFGAWMLEAFNQAGFCLMASVGHRCGLFDTMRDMPASTSGEIAVRAGLNERYVREWLGAMTTSRVVECTADDATYRYSLPVDHAAWLTRAAGADNLAALTQYVALLGAVEDDIVKLLSPWWWSSLRALPPLSRGDGRGQWPVGSVVAGTRSGADGSGASRCP